MNDIDGIGEDAKRMIAEAKEKRAQRVADHIAARIFDIGRHRGERPARMEFKVGDWRDGTEKGAGGLCESALAKYIAEAISSFEAVQP